MKIAAKISISFFVIAITLTTIVVSIFYIIAKDYLEEGIVAHLSTAAWSRKAHVETYLEKIKVSTAQLSNSDILEDFLKTPWDASGYSKAFDMAMIALKEAEEVNPYIYGFLLLNTTGKVVASSDKSDIGLDRSTDAYFLRGQSGLYIKDAYYSETVKEPLIAVSAPILDDDTGKFLGVLVSRVKLTDLWKITTSTTGLGRTGEVYIVNKDGYMITSSRFLKDTFLREKVDTENFRLCQLHKEDVGESVICRNYRGNMVLGTHAYIPEMKWALLTEIDIKEAFAPLKAILFTALIMLFLTPLAAWLIGVAVARGITAPIRRLHKGTEIIAAGDLEYKVSTPSKDEVGQLSRAFDTMTENLKKKIITIKDLDNDIVVRKKAGEDAAYDYDIQRTVGLFLKLSLEDISLNEYLKKSLELVLAIPWLSLESRGAIFLVEDDPEVLVMKVQQGLSEYIQKACQRVPFGKCHCGRAALTKEIEFADRIDARHEINYEGIIPHGHYCVPILYSDKVLGVLNTYLREGYKRNERIEHFLLMLTNALAGGIERKRAEEAKKRLVEILETTPDFVGFADAKDKHIIYINKAGREMTGIGADEDVAKLKIFDIHPEWTNKMFAGEILPAAVRDGTWEGECAFLNIRDGHEIPISMVLSTHRASGGEVEVFSTISRDITDRKKMVDALRESETRYRSSVELTGQLAWTTGSNGEVVEDIPLWRKFTGLSYEETKGSGWTKALHPEDAEHARQVWATAVKNKSTYEVEFRLRRFDGVYRDFLTRGIPVRKEDGSILEWVGVNIDITDRRKVEESQRLAQLGQLVAAMAHEVNNPLMIITGNAQLALMEESKNRELKDELSIIVDQCERAKDIIQRLLKFAKPTKGEVKKVSINDCIETAAKLLEHQYSLSNIKIMRNYTASLPAIAVDEKQIQEVFINLFSNSLDAMPGSGVITIKTSQAAKNIRIDVADTGTGIKEENLKKVSLPFFTTKEKGTGLGLAVCHGIIRAHNGEIKYASKLGEGTTVTILLPIDGGGIKHNV